jgi:hypothetical protein
MGKKSGYMPETPVFLGTTNVNQARKQRGWRLAIFITFFSIDILFALVRFKPVEQSLICFHIMWSLLPDKHGERRVFNMKKYVLYWTKFLSFTRCYYMCMERTIHAAIYPSDYTRSRFDFNGHY